MIIEWTCELCGRKRPDKKISVLSYLLKGLAGATRNLRYCNDNPACISGAILKRKGGNL